MGIYSGTLAFVRVSFCSGIRPKFQFSSSLNVYSFKLASIVSYKSFTVISDTTKVI